MTREEAINHIKTVSKMAIDNGYTSDIVDACAMVVKALEQEPTKEEKALLQKFRDNRGISIEEFEEAMDELNKQGFTLLASHK